MRESKRVMAAAAPKPLGAYSHAVRAGDFLYLSGQGARDPRTGDLVTATTDASGGYGGYDIGVHTRACLENVKAVLESAGGSFADVVDVTVLLLNMDDFDGFNRVYQEYFAASKPARTTLAVRELPLKNVIEIKAIAYLGAKK